jgi:tRNA (uracil-5-)-methyltransferase
MSDAITPSTPILSPHLPGYECQLGGDAVLHSKTKLEQSALELRALRSDLYDPEVVIEQIVCTEEESLTYRCEVGFQFVRTTDLDEHGLPNYTPDVKLSYAMRNNYKPDPLVTDHFPIANERIQTAMVKVLAFLNSKTSITTPNASDNSLIRNLLVCNFKSSWNQKDCLLTFSYSEQIADDQEFYDLANEMLKVCDLTSVTGRPKGKQFVVGREPRLLYDDIHIPLKGGSTIAVQYHKPEDAFQHPNESTMLKALGWILSKIGIICAEEQRSLNLLEMYCGCGAHTIAIGKCSTKVIEKIVAVELDQRLVDSCSLNVSLNGLSEVVTVRKGDAGIVARSILGRLQRRTDALEGKPLKEGEYTMPPSELDTEFDILLVDPPRSGLDDKVMALAKHGGIKHLLYVSCGRHALKANLEVLGTHFEVKGICLTDLFPRTDSVETLVWLQRKEPSKMTSS